MKTKDELRQTFRERRTALASEERRSKSVHIAMRLSELEAFRDAEAILTFVSMGSEVDTLDLIGRLLREGRAVFIPYIEGDALLWFALTSLDELDPSSFGVLEPPAALRRSETVPADAPVLVPGLAFTREGYRIGYGKAFYDGFLPGHSGTAIGLAFDCQLVDAMPIEAHDHPVDILVTESGVYACGAGG